MSKGRRLREARSTGIKVEAKSRHHQEVTDPGEGKHLWAVFAVWKITNPASDRFELDMENLVTLEGPGCFKCEESYTPELALEPCKGSVVSDVFES